MAAAGLAVGLLWSGCYGLLFRDPAHALVDGETHEYTLEAVSFPKTTSWGGSLDAEIHLDGQLPHRVRLYGGDELLELRPGDIITAPVRLSSSDFVRGEASDYYPSAGIYLLGSVKGTASLIERLGKVPIRYWPQAAAKAIQSLVAELFPADVSGFLIALLTGDKSELPTGLYTAFRRSGVAHIVAVSGLHISILSSLLALFLGRRSRLGYVFTMLLILFFAAVAGNSPSALRAAFMAGVLLLAPLVGREDDKPTTLSLVLVVLLLICPYAAASVSLQLSFTAVAGIYLITGPLNETWLAAVPKGTGPLGKLLHSLLVAGAGSLALTLGALLFSTPISALYFRSVSLVGILTNLLTFWAVAGTFLGGLATALTGLLCPPLGSVLAWIVAWPARWVIWIARALSRLPFASVSLFSGLLIVWFLLAYGIVLLWLFARKSVRPVFPISAITATLCVSLLVNAWPALTGALTVTVLDVGQGASTLLISKGRTVLVDCGGNAWDDAGDIAADHLQALGVSRLDALILTHYHFDHAGGVPELLERVEVSLLLLPDVTPEEPLRQEILALADAYGCDVELLHSDAHITFGDASLEIYEPLGSGGANEEGLSVLCTADDFDVLITGDMNDVVERRLVKYKALPDIELLVVGHHGSKSSTSEELLLATTPELAVISSGYNTYGHPADETLERLGAAGCEIYRTDQMGTVTFTIRGT